MSLFFPLSNRLRRKLGITEFRRWFGTGNRDDTRTYITAFLQGLVGFVLLDGVIFREALKRLHQFGDLIEAAEQLQVP
jgi:hypothetical protein